MNTELALMVLSLLGDVQFQTVAKPSQPPEAVYAAWQSTGTIDVNCPDPSSGIDPSGQPVILAYTDSKCKGGSCVSATSAGVVMVYPDSKVCHVAVKEDHHQVFTSMLAAGEFRLACAPGACTNWQARPATEPEVVEYVLGRKGWMLDHFPAGDSTAYPEGVWQVWVKDEKRFDNPLGTGSSALKAVADAL